MENFEKLMEDIKSDAIEYINIFHIHHLLLKTGHQKDEVRNLFKKRILEFNLKTNYFKEVFLNEESIINFDNMIDITENGFNEDMLSIIEKIDNKYKKINTNVIKIDDNVSCGIYKNEKMIYQGTYKDCLDVFANYNNVDGISIYRLDENNKIIELLI